MACSFERLHHVQLALPAAEEDRARAFFSGVLGTDLDALALRLTEAGAPVLWDPDFPGFRRIYSADPWGNRLEFLEPTATCTSASPS